MSKITDLIEKVNKEAIRAEGCNNGVVEILTELLPQIQSIQSEQQEMIDALNKTIKIDCAYCSNHSCKKYANYKCLVIDERIKLLEKITGKPFGKE